MTDGDPDECMVSWDDGYEEGDLATLRLTVRPDDCLDPDATTGAQVTLTSPSGTTVRPVARPEDGSGRARWSATVVLDEPGEWVGRWTVSGTGAGVQPFTLPVAPVGAHQARSYATTADLARHTGRAPEPGAARRLATATEWVDGLIETAVYDVTGPDDLPADPRIAAALRDAVCAWVAWWDEAGDETGSGAADLWDDVAIGTVRLGGRNRAGGPTGGPTSPPPGVTRALRRAGIANHGPLIPGRR